MQTIRRLGRVLFFLGLMICGPVLMAFGGEDPAWGLSSPWLESQTPLEAFSGEEKDQYRSQQDGRRIDITRFKGIDEASAYTLMDEQITAVQALYENALSAYPGEVSNRIVCSEAFQPRYFEKVQKGAVYKYFLLYSTERFGLGACTKDSIAYQHLLGWLYCSQQEGLYVIRYFIPQGGGEDGMEQDFLSLSCGSGTAEK